MDSKKIVLNRFLDFVSEFVPLNRARLATLGGHGDEAVVWTERDIPHENGWLIERNRSRGVNLIAKYHYHVQNQLSTFSQILSGFGKEKAFIDGFHLDLCGTFGKNSRKNLQSVMDLLLASEGRCFAITIADQRRNRVLEEWSRFYRRGIRIFGRSTASLFYNRFVSEQSALPVRSPKNLPAFFKHFDPTKAAKREFGFLVEFVDFLSNWQISFKLERHVYISRYSGKSFRMRSYFFHFEDGKNTKPSEIAKRWFKMPLCFTTNDNNQIKKGNEIMQTKVNGSRLAEIARVLGGHELEEYNDLVASKMRFASVAQAMQGALRQEVVETAAINVAIPPLQNSSRRTATVKKTFENMSEKEKIEWIVETLEKRNGHRLSNRAWQLHLKNQFGYYNSALGLSARSTLARACGKFRTSFLERIDRSFSSNETSRLVDRLSRIK
jgi:hypothetical protein